MLMNDTIETVKVRESLSLLKIISANSEKEKRKFYNEKFYSSMQNDFSAGNELLIDICLRFFNKNFFVIKARFAGQ